MASPPLIGFLSKYLIHEKTYVYKEWFPIGTVRGDEITTEETFRLEYNKEYYTNGRHYLSRWDIDDVPFNWKGDKLPWNGLTCLTVVHYVVKLHIDGEMRHVIWGLDNLACYYRSAKRLNLEKEISQQIKEKFSRLFVNFFIPMAREFFRVPKLNEVLVKDTSLKENEILASFLDFLLQILNSEEHIKLDNEENKYAILQKELTFLLTLLGDMPFRNTELEQVRNILGEIENLANEAGNFIYSCLFTLHPHNNVDISFEGQCENISEMLEILNIKIKKFSNYNSTVISPTNHVMDSTYIVDSLIQDLENLMENQIYLIVDELKVEIRNLHEELMISRSLLNDIGRPQDSGHMDELNESTSQVRDVAYEAEYLVNSYVVANIPLWYFHLRLLVVISKFKLTRTRLQETKIIFKKDFGRELVSTQTDQGTPTTKVNDIVVGFEVEMTKISEDLCGGGKDRQTVTIFGMPGIGKTTIANKLFNNRLIVNHFDERGCCVVSQAYERGKVLTEILESLSKSNIKKKDISDMSDENLSVKIHQCLYNRRYLIYLDDVWSMDVWDDLQRFFPDEGNGSRIMLTSRIRDVSPPNSIVHSLTLLTEEQSWSLLEMKVFPKEELQSIGKRIAAKCGGLPLTIVVTAGVLVNLENEESQWEKVEKNLDSYIFSVGTDEYYSKILELSFKHLPNRLKMCFLYVGAFREDEEIQLRKLMRLWISEGFVQREKQDQKNLELVAEEYLKDLINRSLILIAKKKTDGGIKSCKIHDQLRKMCLRISHEELFSKSVHDRNYSIFEKNRRMFDNNQYTVNESVPFGLYYRSFLGNLQHPSSRLPQMKLLRVMDLRPDSDSTSYELKKVDLLVQLRYLSLDKMPYPIHGNFVNLEFLVINSYEMVYIPLVILKLAKLRHLHIKNGAVFEEDCYNCQSITSLRYFSEIEIYSQKENEVLRCSPHLIKLKCYYMNPTLFPDLDSHPHLQTLSLQYRCDFSGELSKVKFPSTITILKLNNLGLPWEEISIIGRLTKLRVLKLYYHAFVGEKWETREGEFQELMFLRIQGNETLKEWITCSNHFPQLECLEVRGCINLKEIPSEIGDIPTLKIIKVFNIGDGAYRSAVEIVEEQHDLYGNEELQLETRNDITMEEIKQFLQKQNLKRDEYVSDFTFTEEGAFPRIEEIETENDKMAEKWPQKVNKELHEHDLVLTKRVHNYICDGCNEYGFPWSYCCKDCDFDLHPKCALDEEDYHNGKEREDEEKNE